MGDSAQLTGIVIDGRYKITGFLRRGRIGDTYIARTVEGGDPLSLRILPRELMDNPEARARFKRGADLAMRFEHRNVLKVLEAGTTEDHLPWMRVEHVKGELLSERLEEDDDPLTVGTIVEISAQIALALESAHAMGVIHRDVAPENILLAKGSDGGVKVKVLDFGLSTVMDADENATEVTAVGIRVGEPTYMSPEYIRDFALDHRADLYSLGVVMYEMLTGEPPFTGRPYKVLTMHLKDTPEPPSSKVPTVPAWLDELVLKLLEKEPLDRLQTATHLLRALEGGSGREWEADPEATSIHEVPAELKLPPKKKKRPRKLVRQDPVLERLIDNHVIDITKRSDQPEPDRRSCVWVEAVARNSIAGRVGVRPGMLLVQDADGIIDLEPTVLVERRTYVFHDPESHDEIELFTTGIPIGIRVLRTPEHIRAFAEPADDDGDYLFDLWMAGDLQTLESISVRALNRSRGMLQRLVGSQEPDQRDHPAMLYYGIVQFEAGQESYGIKWIRTYLEKYARNHADFHEAVALGYRGLDAVHRNDRDAAQDDLSASWALRRTPRVGKAIEAFTRAAPTPGKWVGLSFPNYELSSMDGRSVASLAQTLETMDGTQVLAICLLGGFRGNLRYNRLMRRFLQVCQHFGDFVVGMHVATTLRERGSVDAYYQYEDLAVEAGVPLVICEDYRAFVQREVKPKAIPTVYLVNRDGVVVHEGLLDMVGLWDALAQTGQLRIQQDD